MRALEDALAIAQANDSSLPHPLLTTSSILGELEAPDSDKEGEVDKVDRIAESFGTLHINEQERTEQFFGPSGGSEVSLSTGDET